MIEKIGPIRNPLTIIAVFAGLAEVSGTVVLPFLASGLQGTYLWFLIGFPTLLVALFFGTLNFNHKVLYAPSDFKDEENFFRGASPQERAQKIDEEVREIQGLPEPDATLSTAEPEPRRGAMINAPAVRSFLARGLLAEELVLRKLSDELGGLLHREVRFQAGPPYVFDALISRNREIIGVEVKYVKDASQSRPRLKDGLCRIVMMVAGSLPDPARGSFSLVFAVATDSPANQYDLLTEWLREAIRDVPFPVNIRVFNLGDLEREAGLGD